MFQIFIFILIIVSIVLIILILRIYSILSHYKKLEEEFKREKDQANAIISCMGEGLLVLDNAFKIKLINPTGERLLETTAKEAVNQNWAEFVSSYVGDKEINYDQRSSVKALQSNKIHITTIGDDHYYKTRSGRKFPITAVSAPFITDGQVMGVVKVFREVSREKEIDRMKTEFISLASHQLRTPLSALKWFSELLLDGNSGELNNEQKQFVKNISDSTERMIELVNSLLNISRIESGRIIIDPKPTDLIELVRTLVVDLTAKIEEKKQKLIISNHETIPLINIDPKMIRHVYMNLIHNSIKYTPPGGELTIIISKKDDVIISQISDNGYGIPQEQQSKIFQKFFRASNIINNETEGTGLGLYLVKAIIESSKGKIWFKSEENKGTTFWFSLPIIGMEPKKGEVTLDA